MKTNEKKWLDWLLMLRAIAQIGKTYTKDPYDLERYEQLQGLVHEMYAWLTEAPVGKIDALFLPEQGYATPKVDLRCGVFREDKILLVKERSDGCWTLPGGWADVLESPKQGTIREVKEESGYDVDHLKLVAIVDRSLHPYEPLLPYHVYKLFFIAEIVGGQANVNIEIDQIDFFARETLPELSRGRVLPEDILRLFDQRNSESHEIYIE